MAAQIAVQYLTEVFQNEAKPSLPDPFLFLSRGLTNAHHAIVDYSFDRALPEAPRTTCVACIVQGGLAYWAHAGDSRLYLLRRGQVALRTRDHSRVQMLLDEGMISAEEALVHRAATRSSAASAAIPRRRSTSRARRHSSRATFSCCAPTAYGARSTRSVSRAACRGPPSNSRYRS